MVTIRIQLAVYYEILFGSVCSFGLLNCVSEKSNCEEANDDIFLPSSQIPINMKIKKEKYTNSKDNSESNGDFINLQINNDSTSEEEEQQNESSTTLEKCTMTYNAGYLAKKCLDKFHCEQCQKHLTKSKCSLDDNNQLLIEGPV